MWNSALKPHGSRPVRQGVSCCPQRAGRDRTVPFHARPFFSCWQVVARPLAGPETCDPSQHVGLGTGLGDQADRAGPRLSGWHLCGMKSVSGR